MSDNSLDRRAFVQSGLGGLTAASVATGTRRATAADDKREFRVWCFGCAHVGTDLRVSKRRSLAEAIEQSESGGADGGPAFEWDLALGLGDFSGNQGSPADDEGREVVRQFSAAKRHRREDFYTIAGNHDASCPGEKTMGWFRKWLDPEGQHTEFSGVDAAKRRYAIDGTWERYAFRVGNVLLLMMSDRNDGGPPVGRDVRGGYPAGAVTGETFRWWQDQVEANRDAVVISAHHHMLKETTFASGEWEGFRKNAKGDWQSYYHGYFPKGGPRGASYLYWLDAKPDAGAFESYLAEHPGAIDFWLGGHTHSNPDDDKGGRTHVERKWGVNFVNCSALSRNHGRTNVPMSRLLTFTAGSDKVRVQCYLHTSQFAPQGFYDKAERVVSIGKPFQPPAA